MAAIFTKPNLGQIPPDTIVVTFAPQAELLDRATLCITHAGLNTVHEALEAGVPLVAIPIGYDQPGVATRIDYQGVGRFVPLDEVTIHHLVHTVLEVLGNASYRDKARFFQQTNTPRKGLERAAEIVEQSLTTHLE